eukprot:scaffold2849_cov203-Alexandrium_tamarense.AAC.29
MQQAEGENEEEARGIATTNSSSCKQYFPLFIFRYLIGDYKGKISGQKVDGKEQVGANSPSWSPVWGFSLSSRSPTSSSAVLPNQYGRLS